MNRDEKQAFVQELRDRVGEANAVYLTDFTGLSVKKITEFRARLREEGVDYVVVKNTLAKLAFAELDYPDVAEFFNGPTGLVIGREDVVTAAKAVTTFAKENEDRPAVKVGLVDRREVTADEVKRLADLPPREQLYAMLLGGMQAPLARVAGGMNNLLAQFGRAVDSLRRQREESGE